MTKNKISIILVILIFGVLTIVAYSMYDKILDSNNENEIIVNNNIEESSKTNNETVDFLDENDLLDSNVTEGEDNSIINNQDSENNIDLSVKPNEVGEVMVLMYHNIGEKESEWVRRIDNFKKDLEVLYNKGYRPIKLIDFIENNITTEAGYTPVVLTFDDGNLNNFNVIDEEGKLKIDPNCVIGIMEEFHKQHPDFPLHATFFLNGTNPFRQKEYIDYKLNYLIENGFDIGNHTIGHDNMSLPINQNPERIQKCIGKQANFLESFVSDYKIESYALCFGARPKDKNLYRYLSQGEYNSQPYHNKAILNVGWRPSVSSIDKRFNQLSIQRVRASETNVQNVGMYDWISYFDKHPEKRFISDGKKDIISVPKKYKDLVNIDSLGYKSLNLY